MPAGERAEEWGWRAGLRLCGRWCGWIGWPGVLSDAGGEDVVEAMGARGLN